jgi:hypothetical protein
MVDLNSTLGLSTVVAVAAGVGGIAADILKAALSNYFVSRRTEKHEAKKIYEKYKKPLSLSATELANRFSELIEFFPTSYLSLKYLRSTASKSTINSDSDYYFRKYKLVSTAYRFCSFLGWLEIYRRDTVFLSSGDFEKDGQFDKCISKFRSALSDGQLNTFENWQEWSDYLVFREELRAVGESMAKSASNSYQIMGYADFEDLLEGKNASGHRWLTSTLHFFVNQKNHNEFRKIRFCLILISLCDLIVLLGDNELPIHLGKGKDLANRILKELNYVEL